MIIKMKNIKEKIRKQYSNDYLIFLILSISVFLINFKFSILAVDVTTSNITKIQNSFQLFCDIFLKNIMIVYIGIIYTYKTNQKLFYCVWIFNGIVHALMCSIFPFNIAKFIYPLSLIEIITIFIGRYFATYSASGKKNPPVIKINMLLLSLLLMGAFYEVYIFPTLIFF